MIKAFNKFENRFRISIMVSISILILIGTVTYFVNYIHQKKAYDQLKFEESQINILMKCIFHY